MPHAEKLRQQKSRLDESMSLLDSLRWYYNFQGQGREEIEINEQLWDLSKELKGLRDYFTLENARLLSESYSDEGYHSRAEEIGSATLDLQREILGGMHQETLLSMDTMATIYYMSGLYGKAEDLWLELVALYKEVYGTHHRLTLWAQGYLAKCLRRAGSIERGGRFTRVYASSENGGLR
jgi:Tetratricopeptide repeat